MPNHVMPFHGYGTVKEADEDASDALSWASMIPGPIGQAASTIEVINDGMNGDWGKVASDGLGAIDPEAGAALTVAETMKSDQANQPDPERTDIPLVSPEVLDAASGHYAE